MHGWLIVNKPEGPTSFDVIRQIRRLSPKLKCGHAGTLDPLASGVLPVAIGEATKIIPWVMDTIKVYLFTIAWGEQRTTDDREGAVVATSSIRPSTDDILNVLPLFCGTIQQTPPLYSAIKIAGKRACDRVRLNESVTLQPRSVWVKSIDIIDDSHPGQTILQITCGKGVYVRSLARDMAIALGSYGYAATIHRCQVGKFKEDYAISLEKLALSSQISVLNGWQDYLQPLDTALDDIPAVQVDRLSIQAIGQGQSIALNQVSSFKGQAQEDQPLLIYDESELLIAIAYLKQGCLWPKRVFNYKI